MDNETSKRLNISPLLFKIVKILFTVGTICVALFVFVHTEFGNISFDPSNSLSTNIKSAIVKDVVDSSFQDTFSESDKEDVEEILDKYATSETLDKTWEYIQNNDEEGFMQYLSDIVSEEDQQILQELFGDSSN